MENDIIDKIKAEIKHKYDDLSVAKADEMLELGKCLGLKMSLAIIDEFLTESENKE